MNKQLKKYLHSRAVTTPWEIEGTSRNDFAAVIIIPALAEAESLPQTLASLTSNPAEDLQQTLVVVVVNNRAEISAAQFQNNQQTLSWLRAQPFPQLNLAWVDASTPGLELPSKEGVGLARKIGFDLALAWLQSGRSLFISLDADTLVDENYLPAIFAHFETCIAGGAVLPFRHQLAGEPQQEKAIRYYELYLRSYLFGLQQAGSPYAFHTIGSTIACHTDAYVRAGGMKRRLAAEDFYFLQQLAKTTGVETVRGTLVQPSPRFSDRVPFGTGKAVQEQVVAERSLFQFSSKTAFVVLQSWLSLAESSLDVSAARVLQKAAGLSPLLHQLLVELNFVEIWRKLQANYPDLLRRRLAFHHWFDGLRTRQLLSRLDAAEMRAAEELVEELLDWGGYSGVGRTADQLVVLEGLLQVTNN